MATAVIEAEDFEVIPLEEVKHTPIRTPLPRRNTLPDRPRVKPLPLPPPLPTTTTTTTQDLTTADLKDVTEHVTEFYDLEAEARVREDAARKSAIEELISDTLDLRPDRRLVAPTVDTSYGEVRRVGNAPDTIFDDSVFNDFV